MLVPLAKGGTSMSPNFNYDVPLTLTFMAFAMVGYLIICQREHIRRRARARRSTRR